MKISQGDTVVVIAGKDKGKQGTVVRTLKNEHRVIVSGVNMVTKHIKKTAQSEGKKITFEHSIHVSNVMILDPKTKKPTRIGYKRQNGKKVRVSKKSGALLERIKTAVKDSSAANASTSKAFWKKDSKQSDTAGSSGKADAGPAHSNVMHTRSAGRGS